MTKKISSSAPLIVGLTGGIGSGKSTVAKAFIALGIQVVDADYASRALVEPGMPALKAIVAHFGTKLMLPDGCLNRSALRQIIFSDKMQKSWLESLLHPLIQDWIRSQLKLALASSPYVILESPLLFEAEQHLLVSEVLLVDVPVDIERKQSFQNIVSIRLKDNFARVVLRLVLRAGLGLQRCNEVLQVSQR